MTENNLSQPESKNPENTASEPSADASDTMAVTKASTDAIGRKGIIAIIVAFIVGALVSGLVVGGFAFLNTKNGRNVSAASHGSTSTVSDANDSCSTTFTVVASVNQWGALAQELGGKCAQVTSLINSTSVEPHDYEPTPADLAKLSKPTSW